MVEMLRHCCAAGGGGGQGGGGKGGRGGGDGGGGASGGGASAGGSSPWRLLTVLFAALIAGMPSLASCLCGFSSPCRLHRTRVLLHIHSYSCYCCS